MTHSNGNCKDRLMSGMTGTQGIHREKNENGSHGSYALLTFFRWRVVAFESVPALPEESSICPVYRLHQTCYSITRDQIYRYRCCWHVISRAVKIMVKLIFLVLRLQTPCSERFLKSEMTKVAKKGVLPTHLSSPTGPRNRVSQSTNRVRAAKVHAN